MLHGRSEIVPRENGTAELTVDVAITLELEGIILCWGWRIEVLEPLSLESVKEAVLYCFVARKGLTFRGMLRKHASSLPGTLQRHKPREN